MRPTRHSERGSLSTEAALVLTIMLAGCLAIGVAVLNGTEAAAAADAAAQAGARAASKAQTPGGAEVAARTAVASSVNKSKTVCRVDRLNVGSMSPGEPLTVGVSCASDRAGFARYVSGGRRYAAEATEIVDRYRTGPET